MTLTTVYGDLTPSEGLGGARLELRVERGKMEGSDVQREIDTV